MAILKSANLALAFILELCALAAFAYWGFHVGNGTLMQILLGVGAPIIMVVVWGMLLAPRSTKRVKDPLHLILQLVVFGLAAICLAAAEQQNLAVIFAITALINVILIRVWRQDQTLEG